MGKIGVFFDWLFCIAVGAMCLITLFMFTKWLIAYFTEKEKAVVGSRESLNLCIIVTSIFVLLFVMELFIGNKSWVYAAAAFAELLSLPSGVFSIFTPKGICKLFSLKKTYVPTSDLSYEFKEDHLVVYFTKKQKNNMVRYHIGIKNMNTVKILADWYPKHDYKNPLLAGENENEGESSL